MKNIGFVFVLLIVCSAAGYCQGIPSPSIPKLMLDDGTIVGNTNPMPAAIYGASGNAVEVNGEGQLHVVSRGKVDSNNCSDIPLASAGVFIGSATDVLDYSGITILVIADVAGELVAQYSHDNANWVDGETYSIEAGVDKFFTPPVQSAYFRLKYTNGGLPQSTFALCTVLKKQPIKWSSHNINDPISEEDDATLVKAVLTGQRDDGVFSNATLSNSDRLRVVSQSYGHAVAEGDLPEHKALFKFGTRTSVTAGTSSSIWEGPTDLYTYLTAAQQLKVSSSSASDTAAGTGARTLRLIGLDGNYDELEETITLNGAGVVTTAASFLRIHRAYVETCGTGYTNAGIITITNNAGTTTHCVIPAGDGQTLMALWTVPRGKNLFITAGSASTDSNKGARVSLFTRQLDGGILYPWRIRYRAYLFSGNENFPFEIPFALPEKTDIQIRVLTPISAGTTSFGATFDGWYEDVE